MEEVSERVEEVKYATNWEERIEYKLNTLYEELLEFRESFNYFVAQYYKEKHENERKRLKAELEDNTTLINQIQNREHIAYEEKWNKINRFRGVN